MTNEEIEKAAKEMFEAQYGPEFVFHPESEPIIMMLARWHLEQIASLTARLAEAEKDKRRLDWACEHINYIGWNAGTSYDEFAFSRQAIDAAMEGGK